jgi:hypothetical protein
MEELIMLYNKYKDAGNKIMQNYAKNRLIRFYNFNIEV